MRRRGSSNMGFVINLDAMRDDAHGDKYISVFEYGTPEREQLERFAHILTGLSPLGRQFHVGETYFDYGQDWVWTTVLVRDGVFGDCQAPTPAQQERAILSDIDGLVDLAKTILVDF